MPLLRFAGQLFDALVDHRGGRRGRLFLWSSEPVSMSSDQGDTDLPADARPIQPVSPPACYRSLSRNALS
jgi:hypothetical protein